MKTYYPPAANNAMVKFRIDWNDEPLFSALNNMGWRGPDLLRGALLSISEQSVEKMKGIMKKKAGPMYDKRVPAQGGWATSQSIWKRVADSLKADTEPGSTFIRVGATPFGEGPTGQRGGKLAQIMASGMKRFKYSPFLPGEVRSSVRWAMKSGQGVDTSIPLKKKGIHPGFKKYNFSAWMQGDIQNRYEREVPDVIRFIARVSGFSLPEDGFGGLGGY